MNCRHCNAALEQLVIDLGHQPASNAYLTAQQLEGTEGYAPLRVYVCHQCWLVQIPSFHASHELFTADYAYFSSVSQRLLLPACPSQSRKVENSFGLHMYKKTFRPPICH